MTARTVYLTRAMLASALDIAETTIDDMVRLGIIPKPRVLPTGAVRWAWKDITGALASLQVASDNGATDPYLAGARNVTEISERRRGSA